MPRVPSLSLLPLQVLLTITDSEFGFIGEVLTSSKTGQPYLHIHASSDVSRDETSAKAYRDTLDSGFDFVDLQTMLGEILTSQKV